MISTIIVFLNAVFTSPKTWSHFEITDTLNSFVVKLIAKHAY